MRNTFPPFRPWLHLCCSLFVLLFGSTAALGQTSFAQRETIATMLTTSPAMPIADFDNDSDNDIITADSWFSEAVKYVNDGYGNFSAASSGSVGTLSSPAFASDLDQDGDIDVLKISAYYGRVYVCTNDGSANFVTTQLVADIDGEIIDANISDIDNDGDDDLLYAYDENKIAWRTNNGDGTFSEEHFVTTIDAPPFTIAIVDVNNDGNKDIATFIEDAGLTISNIGAMNWYANDGNGNFADTQTATFTNNFPVKTNSIDMDSDGDEDIVAACAHWSKLVWYENEGDGNFSTEKFIGFHDTEYLLEVNLTVADIDNDNDLDIISSSAEYKDFPIPPKLIGVLSWHENTGNNTSFERHLIAHSTVLWGSIVNIYPDISSLADFDNDQDIDILYYDHGTNELRWYENLLNTPSQPAPPPIAAFTTTPSPQTADTLRICEGQNVSFLNQSQNANAYLWNFGDGTTTTQDNPQHSFQQTGTYTVSLVAAQNTPLTFECEASAGYLGFGYDMLVPLIIE
ncbi:MAG: VCBS repeat-containing protein, partial [Chitinophagales bacterium]|nr:VCBS repeat-containing protein [Chitinophagales bacterium]